MKNVFILITAIILLLIICILLLVRICIKQKEVIEATEANVKNLEELNGTLRMQRHDYLNQLQVVYGLMEIEEYDSLKEYLEPYYKDLMKTGKAIKTKRAAVNALFSAKSAEAEREGIDFYIEIKSDLKNIAIPDWELCKILSNIIDNAITALQDRENKKIRIDVSENEKEYLFEISNNGPAINEKAQNEIFKKGVTTKKGEGHGMGLYIVMNAVKNHKGSLRLESNDKETGFFITFPK